MTLTRREWLAWVGLAPILARCGPPPPAEWQALAERAADWFAPGDLGAARAIGSVVLDGMARDEVSLAAELGPTLALLEDGSGDCDAAIADDFAARRLRDARGWTLAATEAHLCALVALYGVDR